jgi:uncharacterized protein VirK/YbjX
VKAILSSTITRSFSNLILIRNNLSEIFHKCKTLIFDETITEMMSGHISVIRAFNNPSLRLVAKKVKSLQVKYFRSYYLLRGFSRGARRESLKFHYEFVARELSSCFLEHLLEGEKVIWRKSVDEKHYCISLALNLEWPAEGELRLSFYQNDSALCNLTCTIIPGHLAGCSVKQILLISNVQGVIGKSEELRQAMKACNRVVAPHMLLVAAGSVAKVMNIDIIGGVSNKAHLWKNERWSPHFVFDYDKFWGQFTEKISYAGIYEIPVPIPIKQMEMVKSNQRQRAIGKRVIINEISSGVSHALANFRRAAHKIP